MCYHSGWVQFKLRKLWGLNAAATAAAVLPGASAADAAICAAADTTVCAADHAARGGQLRCPSGQLQPALLQPGYFLSYEVLLKNVGKEAHKPPCV